MNIKEYLEHNGINATAFAEAVGVNQSTIWRYINRRAQPNASTIKKIIAASNGAIRAEDLLFELAKQAS